MNDLAAIRRAFAVLLVLLAAHFVPGSPVITDAEALEYNGVFYSCYVNSSGVVPAGCTKATAWSQCDAVAQVVKSVHGYSNARCAFYANLAGDGQSYQVLYATSSAIRFFNGGACPAGTTWDDAAKECRDMRCEVARDFGIVTSGSFEQVSCLYNEDDGGKCEVAGLAGPDGFVHLYATGDTCDPDNYTCPEGYYEDTNGACSPKVECPEGVPLDLATGKCVTPKECPAGSKKDPFGACVPDDNSNCPAGQIKGPDGLCIGDPNNCPAGSAKKPDGGCGKDADGDGNPDEVTENTATDSASCDAPPICSGDEIMCVHAMQLWRIDCNTRRHANVQLDAYCKTPPICERSVAYDDNRGTGCTNQEQAMMFLEWKTMCEVTRLADALADDEEGPAPGDDGDANNNGQPDWTEDPGTDPADGVDLGDGDADGSLRSMLVTEGDPIGAAGLDTAGFGFARTCPTIPDVVIGGRTIAFNTSKFCEWLQLGGQFVLLMAGLASLRIMAGGSEAK